MQMFTGDCCKDGLSSVLSGRVETRGYRSNWVVSGVNSGVASCFFAQILLVGQIPEPVLYPICSSEKLTHRLRGLPAYVHLVAALLSGCCH